ncbi:MAG: cytidylate kinase family protein, partial [Bacteroidales bacterium]|nr:cytidylate kinase family protein [Bacteroidales bacterium]
MKKVLITVGRELGSGGLSVARELSKKLGIPVYDRELINMAAKESGLATEVFENSDEKPVNVGKIARYFG